MGNTVKLILALLAVAAIVLAAAAASEKIGGGKSPFASCPSCGGGPSRPVPGLRRGGWVGGRGPYNLQLYDGGGHIYPHYEGRDYMDAWDKAGRCSASCSASDDGGCTVFCR